MLDDNSEAVRFFDDVLKSFHRAQSLSSRAGIERNYQVAGDTVRLRFANDALVARITPALEHLQATTATFPDLTIHLWDSASTGCEIPSPPWEMTDFGVRNGIRGFNDARFAAAFHMGSGVLSLLDRARGLAIFWIRDARELPYYESGAPLLSVLASWVNRESSTGSSVRCQLVHAAAIGTENGGVLLVGRGGSGKSSTALRSFDSSLRYAADDYCLISLDSQPRAWSLYSSGKVHGADLEKFSFLRASLSNENQLDSEKALFFFHQTMRAKLISSFPIKAIVLPRVTGLPHTKLVPARASQSLMALAPSTIFQLPNAGRDEFQTLSALVKRVPSFVLELGTERAQILSPIVDLLENL